MHLRSLMPVKPAYISFPGRMFLKAAQKLSTLLLQISLVCRTISYCILPELTLEQLAANDVFMISYYGDELGVGLALSFG